MNKKIVYLSGFARSGSTLLCNILAAHPEIKSTPSSPLCSTIQNIRRMLSDDPFFLAQLDQDPEGMHEKVKESIFEFMKTWLFDDKHSVFIDKNRGWLHMIESLRELDPDFKIIVTLRDLRQIYASIERRHRETIFIDFPDHMEHNVVNTRADNMFAIGGIIGNTVNALENLQDIPNIMKHIYFWKYEDFLENPIEQTNSIFEFVGVNPKDCDIDFNNLKQVTYESDSYYRTKYLHKIKPSVGPQKDLTDISPRILNEIIRRFSWFYKTYYPEVVAASSEQVNNEPECQSERDFPKDFEEALNLEKAQENN